MKKTSLIVILIGLMVLMTTSCNRKEPQDPGDLFGPSSFHYIVEGSASPSILWINGVNEPQTIIRAKVTDYQQRPLVNRNVYFQQMGSSLGAYVLANYGYFENGERAMYARTDASGIAQVTFFGPLRVGSQLEMFICAMAQDIDQTYSDGPKDYIKLQFLDATRD